MPLESTFDVVHDAATTDTVPPSTIRVLHVVNGEHYSGAARVQDLLAGALPRFGVEVGFACVKPKLFPEMRTSQETPLFETPMSHGLDIRPAWRLAKLVKSGDYDIVHTHTPRSILVGSLASIMTGRPMVYHVHSPTSRDSSRPFQNWANDKLERLACARATKLIAVSASLGKRMRSLGFSERSIEVVPNGTPCLPEFDRVRPQGVWTIGAVALFRPRKGMEVLLDALAVCRDKGLPVQLRAVGPFETPEYEKTIHERVAKLHLQDHINWVGLSRDVPAELKEIDLFALPSLYGEGLPMVVLEAMSASTPVIASCVEGVPEVVRDGVDGLLVEPNNPQALAGAISDFVSGEADWDSCSFLARERHNSGFSDIAMAEGVANVYRQVLEERSKG